jgi:flagellar biosynthesis chaperone FliJ
MSFGGDYGKDTGTYMTAVKDAIAAMVAAIPEITIKDETNEFDDREFKQEYKKIYRDAEECATILTKALNELPVYYRYHIQKKIVLGKGHKIVRYKTFIKKLNQALHQSLKRKEKKREEIVESVENVEDVEKVENVENVEDVDKFVNQFTKRLRIDDV